MGFGEGGSHWTHKLDMPVGIMDKSYWICSQEARSRVVGGETYRFGSDKQAGGCNNHKEWVVPASWV